MPTITEPYTVEVIHDGILVQEDIRVVKMPRSRFLELVAELLAVERYSMLEAAMLPVAQRMIRFPLGTWINQTRGCGCIVGEYLVAQPEIDRHNLATVVGRRSEGIENMIRARPHGRLLIDFGSDIDVNLTTHLADVGVNVVDRDGRAFLAEDTLEIEDCVDAIELTEG